MKQQPSSSVPNAPPPRSYHVEALSRGLAVLSQFDEMAGDLSLTDLVRLTGLSKSTTFRIVRTLEDAGYLIRHADTQRYRPGLKVLKLGFAALSNLGIREISRPYLERLAKTTGQTVSLSLLDGREIVYIDRVRNRAIVGVVLGLGSRIPAHCASMGKAILAHLPEVELATLLNEKTLVPCTSRSIVEISALHREFVRIRRCGYALNDQELEIGLRAVAAPIRDHDQQVVAAINATGSVRTISRQRLVKELAPQVQEAAGEISRTMGFSGEVDG